MAPRVYGVRAAPFYEQLQIRNLLACQLDWVFDCARDPAYRIWCTVTKVGGESGKGWMQFFPLDEKNTGLSWECLSVLVTAGGVVEPGAEVLGFVELFHGGPIWMGWNSTNYDIEDDHQSCIFTTVWATADDGSVFRIFLHPVKI